MSHGRSRGGWWFVLMVLALACPVVADGSGGERMWLKKNCDGPADLAWRYRLERALDDWCRWLARDLHNIPGTDLYTMNPTLGTGTNPYRDVAGNTFAAAAAAYWLARANPEEEVARPLRGLITLALGTHVAVQAIDRPDIQKWGATLSHADDWHADLFAVALGMLARDGLDDVQRGQLEAILAWEADKQVEYGISKEWRSWPGRWPETSVGESNSWSATLLQVARAAFPGDPRQEAWRASALEYSLNAICLPDDVTSERIVGGKPLKDRVRGANFEPGGIQEHHGFYHPGYMGWPLAYQVYSHLLDESLPASERNPDVYLNNWKFVYDRLKQATFSNGRFIYCAGFGWISYGYGNTQFMPAAIFAAAHYQDPDATRMANEWLALIEHRQSLAGGSVHGAAQATMRRLRTNDFSWYEGQEGCCLAQALWVLDRIELDAIPAPSSEAEFNRTNTGTYHEPHALLVWHRDPVRWASASWRSSYRQWQMVVQPIDRPHLLKFNHNGTGILEAVGTRDEKVVEWNRTETFPEGGFASLGSVGRQSKRVVHGRPNNRVFPMVRQHQALIALPEGPTILIDLGRALDQLWLLREGGLGLRLAADLFTDNQIRLSVEGVSRVFEQESCRDTWYDLGTRQVTIEDAMVIHALAGEGTFQLLAKRQRPTDADTMLYADDPFGAEESLISHELYFGPPAYDRPHIVSPDEEFRRQVFVFYCDPAQAPASPAGQVSGDASSVVVELPGMCTIVVNFDADEKSVETADGPVTVAGRSVRVIR